jgi:hypothetical protein
VAVTRPPVKETMMRRTLAGLGLLLAIGMTGCAGHDVPTVATVNSGAPSAGAGAGAAGDQPSRLKYSECVRDRGFTWFPDPNADGGLTVHVPDDTDQTKLEKAEKACAVYDPGSSQNRHQLSGDDLDKLRQVSQCVRDHGFGKYPDPDAYGSITLDGTSGMSPDDPAFLSAMQTCRKYLPPRKSGGTS